MHINKIVQTSTQHNTIIMGIASSSPTIDSETSHLHQPAPPSPISRAPSQKALDMAYSINQTDSVVLSVINQFVERSKFGKEKYGTDLDRTDLTLQDWIQHAQEELMDGILYLEKLKKTYEKKP